MVSSRRRAIAVLHAGAFLWAFASTLLGAALPLIKGELGLGYAAGGTVFTASSAGFLTGTLIVGTTSARLSGRTLLLLSTGVLVPCLYFTSQVSSYAALLSVVALAGVGGGALTAMVNAGVADLSAERRASALSLLNVSFGAGALLAPLFAGALIAHTGRWQPAYQVTGLLVLALLVLTVWWVPNRFTEHAHSSRDRVHGAAPASRLATWRFVGVFAAVVAAAAAEWGFAYWSATYFKDVVEASAAVAANMAGLFWAGMLAGRLVFGGVLRRADPGAAVTACAAAATAAGALLAVNAGVVLSVVGALLLGASLAAVIPSLLALAIDEQPQASGRISGVLMFASGGGSLLAPAAVGALAQGSSLAVAIWLIPVSALLLLCLHVSGQRATARIRTEVISDGVPD